MRVNLKARRHKISTRYSLYTICLLFKVDVNPLECRGNNTSNRQIDTLETRYNALQYNANSVGYNTVTVLAPIWLGATSSHSINSWP